MMIGFKDTATRIIEEIQKNDINPSELDYNLAIFAYLKAGLLSKSTDIEFNAFFSLLYQMKALSYGLHSASLDFDPFDPYVLEGLRNVFGGIKMAMTTLKINDYPSAETSINNFSNSLSSSDNREENPFSMSTVSSQMDSEPRILFEEDIVSKDLKKLISLQGDQTISNLNDNNDYSDDSIEISDIDESQLNLYDDLSKTGPSTSVPLSISSSLSFPPSSPSSNISINNTINNNNNEKPSKNIYNSRIWIPSNPKNVTKPLTEESDDTNVKKIMKKSVSWPLKSNTFSNENEFYIDNDIYYDINNNENNTVNHKTLIENEIDDYNYEIQDENDEETNIDDNFDDNDKDMSTMRAADVNLSPYEIVNMSLMDSLVVFSPNDSNMISDPEYYNEEANISEESDFEDESHNDVNSGQSPLGPSHGQGNSRSRRRMGRSNREQTHSSNLDTLLSLSNLSSHNVLNYNDSTVSGDDTITSLLAANYSPSFKEISSSNLKVSDSIQGLESTVILSIGDVNGLTTEVDLSPESINALSEEKKRANLKLNMRRIEQIELLTSKRKDRL